MLLMMFMMMLSNEDFSPLEWFEKSLELHFHARKESAHHQKRQERL